MLAGRSWGEGSGQDLEGTWKGLGRRSSRDSLWRSHWDEENKLMFYGSRPTNTRHELGAGNKVVGGQKCTSAAQDRAGSTATGVELRQAQVSQPVQVAETVHVHTSKQHPVIVMDMGGRDLPGGSPTTAMFDPSSARNSYGCLSHGITHHRCDAIATTLLPRLLQTLAGTGSRRGPLPNM